jgi:hypothetical protein
MSTRTVFRAIAWFGAILPVALVAVLYTRLPAQCVMQWSASGQPNWSAPKPFFALSMLAAPAIACLVLLNPGGLADRSMARWGRSYDIIAAAIFAVSAVALVLATLSNLRH